MTSAAPARAANGPGPSRPAPACSSGWLVTSSPTFVISTLTAASRAYAATSRRLSFIISPSAPLAGMGRGPLAGGPRDRREQLVPVSGHAAPAHHHRGAASRDPASPPRPVRPPPLTPPRSPPHR